MLLITGIIIWWFSVPGILFNTPTSTVLEDSNGDLLSARIAADGQWRFPYSQELPLKYILCAVTFEDKNFFYHPGIDPFAIVRAIKQNATAKKTVSGGSTISMQVIRLSRKNKKRNISEKIIEILCALRMELTYTKKEIISLYASHAPFGSNVVGLEAASWRYFGRPPELLSWAETATLAVLPNSPSLIYPGKNQLKLKQKRDRLLKKMHDKKFIDKEMYELSLLEPLPGKPHPLPDEAHHLLNRCANEGYKGLRIQSTINKELQKNVNDIVLRHHKQFSANGIHNAAALVIDVKNNKTLAYIGNVMNENSHEHGGDVDVITAPRSTGSILKPFLYAQMLSEGELLPNMLVSDIPTQIAGYAPQNFNQTYDGAVPAKRALARSLNVPAVRMLRNFGVEKFHDKLKKIGMSTITKSAEHYGLSIILGGAEGKLWDIANIYCGMANTLGNYSNYGGKYNNNNYSGVTYLNNKKKLTQNKLTNTGYFDAAAIKFTFDAMIDVARPEEEGSWKLYTSSCKVAWKTGTSFGFRDGWAVGITPAYIVAVWVGNADGEGRPGLTGIATAAPVLFDIFKLLKPGGWFEMPYDEMQKTGICRNSGHRNSLICPEVDTVWIPAIGLRTTPCPYHIKIHLDKTEKWRVHSDCELTSNMIHKAWFVLPPTEEYYYKGKNPTYHELPPYRADCLTSEQNSMELIYPKEPSKIYVPIELDGQPGKVIFKAAHRKNNATIFWHLDDEFISSTNNFHEIAIYPAQGIHTLTLVDESGSSISQNFEIVSKRK